MSGPVAAMRRRGDSDYILERGPAEVLPDPTLGETIGASVRTAIDTQPRVQRDRLQDAYRPVVDTLTQALGTSPRDYETEGWLSYDPLHPLDADRVWAGVEAARKRGIKMPDLPATKDEFERKALGREGGFGRDSAVLGRSDFGSRLVGGVAGGFTDPGNVAMGILTGGWSKGLGLARGILVDGTANAGAELAQAPGTIEARRRLGEKTTAGDVLTGAAYSFAFGGAFHVAGRAVGAIGPKAFERLPLDIRLRLAINSDLKSLDDEALARAFRATTAEELWTPEQRDAINVVERAHQEAASNPYADTHAGQAVHGRKLQAATDVLQQQRPAARKPVRGGGLDGGIVGFFRGKGYSEAQARGMAAGIHAESRGNYTAWGPVVQQGEQKGRRAYGIGQWIGSRQDELFRRYGRNPSLQQQLEFLDWELKGGDGGGRHVLAAADEAGVLNAYIRKFMRPRAGPETDGDIARGMAALGRDGETPSSVAGIADDIDPRTAIEAERADIEAERMQADDARRAAAAGDLDRIELPQLRRDQFPDETTWRVAQAASDADELGLPEPVVTTRTIADEARVARTDEFRALLANDGRALYTAAPETSARIMDRTDLLRAVEDEGERSANVVAAIGDEQAARLRELASAEREPGADRAAVLAEVDDDTLARIRQWDDDAQAIAEVQMVRQRIADGSEGALVALPIVEARLADAGWPLPPAGLDAFDAPALRQWMSDNRPGAKPRMAATDAANEVPESGNDLPQEPPRAVEPPSPATTEVLAKFDEPDGDGIVQVADSLWHDIRANLDEHGTVDMSDGFGERPIVEIAAALDREAAGLAAARACL